MTSLCVHMPSPERRPPSPTSEECVIRAVPWHCTEADAVEAPASPFAEENNGESMVHAIASWIDSVVERFDEMETRKPSVITVFHAQAKPEISVRDYLIRISKYGNFSKSVGVAALIYIDRVLERHPEIVMTSRTVHRLIIVATLLAAKFNDDVHLGNSAFAQIGGIRTVELNRLEVNFLKLIDFSLVVSSELYSATVSAFEVQARGGTPVKVARLSQIPWLCGLGSPLGYRPTTPQSCSADEEWETCISHPLQQHRLALTTA